MSVNIASQPGLGLVKYAHCKKIAVGFDSLVNGGTSRNSAKNAAFLILPPVLVARMGGRKPCWLAPAVPSLSTRSSYRPHLTVSALVFKPERSRHLMTVSPAPTGAPTPVPEEFKAVRPCAKCGTAGRYQSGKCKACSRANVAACTAKNLPKKSAQAAAWYAANSKKVKEARAANPEARRIHDQNRRTRKQDAGGKLSRGLAKKLFGLQHGKCPCCGLPLGDDSHLDHVIPLALGGANEDWNMQLLRRICNQQKHAKHPVEFMQSRGFLL